MGDLLLRGGMPWRHGRSADVMLTSGTIGRIGVDLDAGDAEVIDVAGLLILPGLIDSHCHLDKTMFGGEWTPHAAQDTLADRIATERRMRGALGIPRKERMMSLLEQMSASGTTTVRTHTDVDPEVGLRRIDAVREVAESFAGRVTVVQAAFPQYGVLTQPGTAELLEEALRSGVGTIGGIDPAGVDRDPVRNLDLTFALAEKYGSFVDIHLHDGGALGAWEIELIIDRVKVLGLQRKVTLSHAYCLGQIDDSYQDRLATGLADAGITITTAAVYSFPVPPIRKLRAAGVSVACGNDGIRDLWGPYGTGDMLDRAMHVAYRSTFRRDEEIELALEAATYGGAEALGLPRYGVTPGAPADLVAVRATSAAEAVVTRPARELVIKAGRVVFRRPAP